MNLRHLLSTVLLSCTSALAAVGDPQVKTDHPWYPGELSCSTFPRLFATQAELYRRVTGREVNSDEDKALASWYWRNLNYFHGEEGKSDFFGKGFAQGEWVRDYWAGLFAHGFSLCGTTHAQFTAEMNALLGHGRGRSVGVQGHNSFEVYLTGGAYGAGRWALLDHDLSTVIFTEDGSRLMSIQEVSKELKKYADQKFKPERQRGWIVSGLHPDDGKVYSRFSLVEYLNGYAGPPPMVHLRRGETLRRYPRPGLEDGKTFVFWGRNYAPDKTPGPSRSRTWVNQPEKMYAAKAGTKHVEGQARYANAVYTYRPDFASDAYKEGVVAETAEQVTFEFLSPYIIAATPADPDKWGIYEAGGTNGLVIIGKSKRPVKASISTDLGKTWSEAGEISEKGLDATDLVKGCHQYLLKLHAPAGQLKDAGLSWRTICQTNGSMIPRLKDGENRITFHASGQGLLSAGPNLAQAEAKVVAGSIGSPMVTLELAAPRGEKVNKIYGVSWQASGNPPSPDFEYKIDYSTDGGQSWKPIAKDWNVVRRDPEPDDFWSQSFAYGSVDLDGVTGPVRVRFTNTGGKNYRKVEAHLGYEVANPSATEVTFAWKESGGALKTASHTYGPATGKDDASWVFPAGEKVETVWVEYGAK